MAARQALRALKSSGPRGMALAMRDAREERLDRARIARLSTSEDGNSSLSDLGLYPAFCAMAASDDEVFARFRRSLIYRAILEHVNYSQGLVHWREFTRRGLDSQRWRCILLNDEVGGPCTSTYEGLGRVCPSTLSYAKMAADMFELFGPLDGMRVAEIGVGYGGQCRVISHGWDVASYDLFDLPEALALTRRFLETSGMPASGYATRDGREPMAGEYDLVISNYAFSELQGDLQERYFERVIKRSPRGYFIYNHISPGAMQPLTAEDFAARIPGARILPEYPLTAPGNVLVVWGD